MSRSTSGLVRYSRTRTSVLRTRLGGRREASTVPIKWLARPAPGAILPMVFGLFPKLCAGVARAGEHRPKAVDFVIQTFILSQML